MWHVPLLDLHGGMVMGHMSIRGTWAMGHMSIRGRVMGTWVIGYIAIIMHRSRYGTGVMGHIVDVFSEFSEYIH